MVDPKPVPAPAEPVARELWTTEKGLCESTADKHKLPHIRYDSCINFHAPAEPALGFNDLPKMVMGDAVAGETKYMNRHGDSCSKECYEGRHEECKLTMFSGCSCTYRGQHKTQHCYMSYPATSEEINYKELVEFEEACAPVKPKIIGAQTEKSRQNLFSDKLASLATPAVAGDTKPISALDALARAEMDEGIYDLIPDDWPNDRPSPGPAIAVPAEGKPTPWLPCGCVKGQCVCNLPPDWREAVFTPTAADPQPVSSDLEGKLRELAGCGMGRHIGSYDKKFSDRCDGCSINLRMAKEAAALGRAEGLESAALVAEPRHPLLAKTIRALKEKV